VSRAFRAWAPWVALAVLAVVGPPLSKSPYIAHLLVLGCLTALLAVGLNIALGYAGLFSFAQGAFYGIGAYASTLIVLAGYAEVWGGILVGGLAAAIMGFVLGLFTIRLGGHYLAIATFAFQEIVYLIIRNWDGVTKGTAGITGIPGPPPIELGGLPTIRFDSELAYYYLVLAVLAVAIAFSARLSSSQLGLELMAVRDDEIAARAMGVRAVRLKVFSFTVSAALAGVAGGLFAHYVRNVSPESFAVPTSFGVLVAVLVGGMGTVMGPVLGGLLLTFLPEYLRAFQAYRFTIYGALLIVVIIAMPTGVAGALRALAARWRATPAEASR
jgi:branched-chain amino acid transport system permease protein